MLSFPIPAAFAWAVALAAFGLQSFAASPNSISGIFDVRAFGATGDGHTLDTPALQRAVDAASAAGGGTVHLPAGVYLSVTVELRSHVTLSLGQGATLLAAPATLHPYARPVLAPEDVKVAAQLGTLLQPSLIHASDVEDIAIIGPGRIVGEGLTREIGLPAHVADKAITLWRCRNVVLRDLTIFRGGHLAFFAVAVDNLLIDNVLVDTERDGIDFSACRNVRISNCSVNSPFDDGICFKSDGLPGPKRWTENVTITNCNVSGFDLGTLLDGSRLRTTDFTKTPPPDATGLAAFGAQERTRKNQGGPTGRIKFGTSSNEGFRNIVISNCVFEYCRGLALEVVDGGVLEDVTISNLTMRDIVNAPIFIRLGNRKKDPAAPVGSIRRVNLNNITVSNADPRHGCIVTGIPGHAIEDIRLTNIRIAYRGGGTPEDTARTPAELEADYPEPFMFGSLPSYGFYLRHVKGLRLQGVNLSTATDDARPAFVLQDAVDVSFDGVEATRTGGAPFATLHSTNALTLRNVIGLSDQTVSTVEKLSLPIATTRSAPARRLRVFVIGDSISQQYGPALERLLAPRFDYDRKRDSGSDVSTNLDIPKGANGGDSRMVLAYLKVRHAGTPIAADVLLLNCGLHDIKRNPITRVIQTEWVNYVENLQAILTEARQMNLQVVWMRTTPVVDEIHNTRSKDFHRFAADLEAYNRAADAVMRAGGVPILDLFTFSAQFIPQGFVDHVHYNEATQEKQAAFLVGALSALAESGQLRAAP